MGVIVPTVVPPPPTDPVAWYACYFYDGIDPVCGSYLSWWIYCLEGLSWLPLLGMCLPTIGGYSKLTWWDGPYNNYGDCIADNS